MGAAPSRRTEWSRLALLFACNVLFAAGLFSHAFLYNFYLDRLGAGEAMMGAAAAALTAGGLIALVPAGMLVDRAGPRLTWLAAGMLAAAGLAAGAFATTAASIYASAFLAGAGTAAWRVAGGPLLMRLTTDRTRERAFSWNVALLLGSGAVWTVAAGAAPAWLERAFGLGSLGGLRAGLGMGALGTLMSVGLFAFFVAPAEHGLGPPRPAAAAAPRHTESGDARSTSDAVAGNAGVPSRSETSSHRGDLRTEATRAGLSLALLGSLMVVAIWMAAGGMVIPFFNLYFLREHDWAVARIGLLFGAAQAITAVVVFASGDLAARFGARRVLLLWTLPFAPLLWGLSIVGSTHVAIVLYVAQGFVPPATNPLIDQLLLERAPPGRQGAVSTGRNAATELAGLAGASAGGSLLQETSFRVLFGVAGALAVVGALGLLLGVDRRDRRGR